MSTESPLPPELEYLIFTICASSDSTNISNLLLVSQQAKAWIEPLRFHSLMFDGSNETDFNKLLSSKGSGFLAQHVRSFCVTHEASDICNISSILYQCTNITNLALWIFDPFTTFPEITVFPRLQYLSLSNNTSREFVDFLSENPDKALALTHLDCDLLVIPQLVKRIPVHLAQLTHFMTPIWEDYHQDEEIMNALAHLVEREQIQVVIFSMDGHRRDHFPSRRNLLPIEATVLGNPKVVIREVILDWIEDWKLRATGGQDIWTRTDRVSHILKQTTEE
ncbi:hypothetical protein DL96DRAFT_1824669 [Flagelloscypha sp. PMI_526]|nr:hypothetical protein DL96DRAFT_1824669 [Flagelloscypha sp. PMI_526]